MQFTVVWENGMKIAVLDGGAIIADAEAALNLIGALKREAGCDRIVIDKPRLTEGFFDLSSRLAGEILQKFVNYRIKAAIVGDFSGYKSQSLKDFIRESNRGKNFFFVSSRREALEKLAHCP